MNNLVDNISPTMSPGDPDALNNQYSSDSHPYETVQNPIHHPRQMRVICIGAGLAGLCFAYKLQRSFEDYDLVIYEKNQSLAGVWFENRYPG